MDFSVTLNSQNPINHLPQVINAISLETDDPLLKRKISSEIDLNLGFNIFKIEETLKTKALQINPNTLFDEWGPMLHNGAQTWIGLDFQIVQVTYQDLKILFDTIKPRPNQKFIDLGAGYGRMGIFLHWFYPNTHFLGIELVPERVVESNRIYQKLKTKNKEMVVGDLFELNVLPEGDVYFIYDFGNEIHLKKILEQLKLQHGNILIVKGEICINIMKQDNYWGTGFKIKKLDDLHLFYL